MTSLFVDIVVAGSFFTKTKTKTLELIQLQPDVPRPGLDRTESFMDLIFGFLVIDLGKCEFFHAGVKSAVAESQRSRGELFLRAAINE